MSHAYACFFSRYRLFADYWCIPIQKCIIFVHIRATPRLRLLIQLNLRDKGQLGLCLTSSLFLLLLPLDAKCNIGYMVEILTLIFNLGRCYSYDDHIINTESIHTASVHYAYKPGDILILMQLSKFIFTEHVTKL